MWAVEISLVVMFIGCLYDTKAIGGEFDTSLMPGKIRECLELGLPKWNFSLTGYCALFTCTLKVKNWGWEWEGGQHKMAKVETFRCPLNHATKGDCYTEDLSVEYPDCCPKIRKSPPGCP